MLEKEKTIQLLRPALGEPKYFKGGDEAAFWCPFCKVERHKKKLQVNLTTHNWHCWICQDVNKSKGKSLFSLLDKLNVLEENRSKLEDIYASSWSRKQDVPVEDDIKLELQREFIPLWLERDTPDYRNAISYLRTRGVTMQDIMKYRIGYCDSGDYANRIIIPSYASDGTLDFWIARMYYENSDLDAYVKAPISSNVVGFESLIDFQKPIVIVEGVFDAMAVRRNAIPLFGKIFLSRLRDKILLERPPGVYVSLDKDAMKSSVRIMEDLIENGINTYVVDIDSKDPSEAGFESMSKKIRNAQKLDFNTLIKYKLYA